MLKHSETIKICPDCFGEGKMEITETVSHNQKDTKIIKCRTCKGSGRVLELSVWQLLPYNGQPINNNLLIDIHKIEKRG